MESYLHQFTKVQNIVSSSNSTPESVELKNTLYTFK